MKPRTVYHRFALQAVSSFAIILGGCSTPQAVPTPTSPPSSPTRPPAVSTSASASPTPAGLTSAQDILDQALQAPHDTATSSDGQVELLIPKGALPSNVTADQIKITPLDVSQLTIPSGIDPPEMAYQMGPDGLQFSTPALLHINVPADNPPEPPIVLLKSGSQITAIDKVTVGLDQTTGKMTILAAIPHFSEVYISRARLRIEVDDPQDQVLGVPFEVRARIISTDPNEMVDNLFRISWSEDPPVPGLDILWLDPNIFSDLFPKPTENSSGLEWTHEFTCLRAGETSIRYTANLFTSNGSFFRNGNLPVQGGEWTVSSEPFNCIPPLSAVSNPFNWKGTHSVEEDSLVTQGELNTATSAAYSAGPDSDLIKEIMASLPGGQVVSPSASPVTTEAAINWHVSSSSASAPPDVGEVIFQSPNMDQVITDIENTLDQNFQQANPPANPAPGSNTTEGAKLEGTFNNKYWVVDINLINGMGFVSVVGGANPSQLSASDKMDYQNFAAGITRYSQYQLFPPLTQMPSAAVITQYFANQFPAASGWMENAIITPPAYLQSLPSFNNLQVIAKDDYKNRSMGQEVVYVGWARALDAGVKADVPNVGAVSAWLQLQQIKPPLQNPTSLILDNPQGGLAGEVYSGLNGSSMEADCLQLGGDPIGILSIVRSTDTSPAGRAQVTDMAKAVCEDQMQLFLNANEPVLTAYGSAPTSTTASRPPAVPDKLLLTIQAGRANIRFGDSTAFGYFWGAKQGDQYYAIGTNSDHTWYEIKRLDKGGNKGWISALDANGNPEVQVSGDVTTLPDTSMDVTFVPSADVPGTSGSVTKGAGNTVEVKWGAVAPVNSNAQAAANTQEYILQVQTIDDTGQTTVQTQATNETSFNLTSLSSRSFHIVKARVIVQEILPSGAPAYSVNDLAVSPDLASPP